MTKFKLESVFAMYLQKLKVHAQRTPCPEDPIKHVGYMCNRCIDHFIPDNKIEKAMRWLGFIQGILFMQGEYTLEELKKHNVE